MSSVHAQKGFSARSPLACLRALDHVWAETLEGEVWTPGEVATVPGADQEAFRVAIRRLFMNEVRPLFRDHREKCSEKDLAEMFDEFWSRFHGYVYAQYFAVMKRGDFAIMVGPLDEPVFRWKAIEMCQHLRVDKGNVTLGTGVTCDETIGGVQAA